MTPDGALGSVRREAADELLTGERPPARRRRWVVAALVAALVGGLWLVAGHRGPQIQAHGRLVTVDDAAADRALALDGLPQAPLQTVRGPFVWHVLTVSLSGRGGRGCAVQITVEHPPSWLWEAVNAPVRYASTSAYDAEVDRLRGRRPGGTRLLEGAGRATSVTAGPEVTEVRIAWASPSGPAAAPTETARPVASAVLGCGREVRASTPVPLAVG